MKNHSFSIKLLLFLTSFILILTVLPLQNASAENSSSEEYQVGMILSLSGVAAEYGIAIKNGVELAKQDRPELFSKVKFIYEDAGYANKEATTIFQKLTQIDKVDLVHSFGATFCQTLAPLAADRGTLFAAECVDPVIAAGRPRILRLLSYSDEYMQVQIKYLREHNLKRIALLQTENGYLNAAQAALLRNLPSDFSLNIVQSFPTTEMDFRTALAKIRLGKYDVMGVFLSAGQVAAFYKQAREQKIKLPSFGTNWFESIKEIAAAEGAMEGALLANNTVKPEFLERYTKLFGSPAAIMFAAPAYEFAILVGTIVSESKTKPDPDSFLAKLFSMGTLPGTAMGPYSLVDDPKVGKYFRQPIVMKQVRGKKLVDLPNSP